VSPAVNAPSPPIELGAPWTGPVEVTGVIARGARFRCLAPLPGTYPSAHRPTVPGRGTTGAVIALGQGVVRPEIGSGGHRIIEINSGKGYS